MKKRVLWPLSAFILLASAGCTMPAAAPGGSSPGGAGPSASSEGKAPAGAVQLQGGYTVLAKGLQTPWALAFDGETIYVSERKGAIVKIAGGTTTRQQVILNRPVKSVGEAGFLGFVLAPDFSKSREAYAYHSYEQDGKLYNRVIGLKETPDGWQETKAYIEQIPGGNNHDGGRLAWGPDGNLYITTGDAGQDKLAQDKTSLAGKILRMTPGGAPPADNPVAGSLLYSYGHRNAQGLAWDAQGRLFSSEHGPSGMPGGHDELNLIEPGRNYGWPDVIGSEQKDGMTGPLYHTGQTAIAPSGVAIDPASGALLVAALKGQKLLRYDPATKSIGTLLEGEGRLRDVKINGRKVYVLTNNTDGRGRPGQDDDRLLVLN